MRRYVCALVAAAAAVGAVAVAGAAPSGASPGTPVWRWDYGVDDQQHPDIANAAALGVGTAGRIQVGTGDGIVRMFTGTGERSIDQAGAAVTAVASDGTHDFVARSGTSKLSVYDAGGHDVTGTAWNTFVSPAHNVAIAVSPHDPYYGFETVWVADSTNRVLSVFSATGSLLAGIPAKPAAIQLSGLAVAPDGSLLELDGADGYVQRLSPQGIALGRFGSFGSGDGQFKNATGIAVDSAGTVFVADTGNQRVVEFDARTGNYLGQFGSSASGPKYGAGDFVAPKGIAVDCVGRLHVLDVAPGTPPEGRVAVYTGLAAPTGTCAGPSASAFTGPANAQATAVDRAGNVYVGAGQTIYKYDATGHRITSWTSPATGSRHWSGVLSLAVGPTGEVYLVDRASHVFEFRSAGAFVRGWSPDPGGSLSSIAVRASDGHLFIADVAQWVKEFTASGTLVRTLTIHDVNGTAIPIFVSATPTETLVLAQSTVDTEEAVERFGTNGTYLGQFEVPRRDAGDGSAGPAAPYPGGGYVLPVADTIDGQAYDTQTDGLVRVTADGTVVSRLLETRFAPNQSPTPLAADCAGRLIVTNSVTRQVLRLATSSAVCRWAAVATTGAVTSSSKSRLTVAAKVNPSAQVTKVRIQYGTSKRYGKATAWVTLPSDNAVATRTFTIGALASGHGYHYRVQATNASGTVYGADRTGRTK